MLEIPFWPFVILVQLAILFCLTTVLFLLLWRRAKKLSRQPLQKQAVPETTPRPDIRQYLAQEEKLTRGRIEALGYSLEKQQNPSDEEERLILALRADMLNIEQEWAEIEERDDSYWIKIIDGLVRTLKRHDLYSRFAMSADDEILELRAVIEKQSQALEDISGNLEEQEAEVLKEKLQLLAHSHKELSSCVFTLEDENHFLREQVAELLKHEA